MAGKPIPRTTTGKGKNYNPTDKGAGMTAKGRAEYNAKNNSNLNISELLSTEVISLPMHTELTEEIQDYIVNNIIDFFKKD